MKYLDENGLLYLVQKIKTWLGGKVDKETGKGLSTNDYTTTEKNKLGGIAEGANKTTVENVLTSTSTSNALSAAQGKALKDEIDGVKNSMGDLGYGDMMKATYDKDGDGVIDNAANASKLGGQAASYYASTTYVDNQINEKIAAADAMILKGSLGTGGTVTALPTTYKTGWTYKVITAGKYAGQDCEVGDMITALVDRNGSGNANSDWMIVQNNIDPHAITNAEIDTICAS